MRLAATLLIAAALAPGARAATNAYVDFKLPSGNIGCGYAKLEGETANLRCEIVSGLRPQPPKPSSCEATGGALSAWRPPAPRAATASPTR